MDSPLLLLLPTARIPPDLDALFPNWLMERDCNRDDQDQEWLRLETCFARVVRLLLVYAVLPWMPALHHMLPDALRSSVVDTTMSVARFTRLRDTARPANTVSFIVLSYQKMSHHLALSALQRTQLL